MKKTYQKSADAALNRLDNLADQIDKLSNQLASIAKDILAVQDDMQTEYDEKSERWQEGDSGVEMAEDIGNLEQAAAALETMASDMSKGLEEAMELLGGQFDPTLTIEQRETKIPHVWRKHIEKLRAQLKTFEGVSEEEATIRVRSGYGDEGTYLKAQLVDLLDHEIQIMIRPDGVMQLYTSNGGLIGRNESSNTMVVTSCDFQTLQQVFMPKRQKQK